MIEHGETQAGEGAAGETGRDLDEGRQKPPAAPKYEDLKRSAVRRSSRAGQTLSSFDVKLKVVTPILGGAAVTRTIDDVDVIRVPTVRGHLRFWWRALYGHEYANAQELYEAEGVLWGQAAKEDGGGGRSAIEVEIKPDRATAGATAASSNIPQDQFYALWPSRNPPADRRLPGTVFTLKITAPNSCKHVLRNVVRAWILFGGYGSRTRRGLGSLTVVGDADIWLPKGATRDAINSLFEFPEKWDIFEPSALIRETPLLIGAALYLGSIVSPKAAKKGEAPEDPVPAAQNAWTTALDWLKEFRQGTNGGRGNRAREPDPTPNPPKPRPSISNWPEADKVRHHSTPERGLPWAHDPNGRHNNIPAWPRTGFGLPIVGQFQMQSRQKGTRTNRQTGQQEEYLVRWDDLPTPSTEPRDPCQPPRDRPKKYGFELRWRSVHGEHDRLASPLILKALPLANGHFVPCALWLTRTLPQNAQVGLAETIPGQLGRKRVRAATVAPFDRLEDAPGAALFAPLRNKSNLRDAFLDWLDGTTTGSTRKATRIAP